jgi:hypothetical protein
MQLTDFGLLEVGLIQVSLELKLCIRPFVFNYKLVVSLFSTAICGEVNYRYHDEYYS